MSAFIVNPKHIAALAAYTKKHPSYFSSKPYSGDPKKIVKILAEANIKSVYELDKRVFGDKCKAKYLEDLMLFPADCVKALKNLGTNGHNYYLSDKDIYNMACCLNYQSCEVENWIHTTAYWIIKAIKDTAAKSMASDAKVSWEWKAA